MATRMSRWTGWPIRLNSSRTSWVLPSPSTIFHHEFMPDGVTLISSTSSGATCCPSTSVPLPRLTTSFSSGVPLTFAMYSRSTP